jgi:hypothetical protein
MEKMKNSKLVKKPKPLKGITKGENEPEIEVMIKVLPYWSTNFMEDSEDSTQLR